MSAVDGWTPDELILAGRLANLLHISIDLIATKAIIEIVSDHLAKTAERREEGP